jgi:protein ImuA
MTIATPLSAPQTARWHPALAGAAQHAELFAPGGEGTGAALALALARDHLRGASDPLADVPDERAWLWVQDKAAIRLSGRPYRPGLPRELRHRLIHVAAASPEDALFAIEEGLRCRDLAFVIGEIAGNPRTLDFTASRRLSLVVERHGVPLWLVRNDAARDLGSARMRWQARSAPSPWPHRNPRAPGAPTWHAELFRARSHPPGEWILRDEGGALHAHPPHHGNLVRQPGVRSLATG